MKSSADVSSTMMKVDLSINHFLDRAGTLFPGNEIVSRLPDKSLVKHTYAQFYHRTRSLAQGLQNLGLKKGDRVATCVGTTMRIWNVTLAFLRLAVSCTL